MGTASARINIDIRAQELLSSGIKAGVIPATFAVVLDLTNGTTDGKADLVYATTTSGVAASTITSYDLAGSLTDSFGTVLTFVEVSLIAVRNKRTTALAYLDVGPHATNGFGRLGSSRGFWPADIGADADQGSIVAPDSWMVVYAKDGVPVTPGSTDVLRITTSAVVGSINSWDLLVIGRSA
jgi:hypothetical protein